MYVHEMPTEDALRPPRRKENKIGNIVKREETSRSYTNKE